MRLDKFLSITKTATRSETSSAARRGNIAVNSVIIKHADKHIDPDTDEVFYCGVKIEYKKYIYILMNKPQGVVSATGDKSDRTVLDLLDDNTRQYSLFPCGRLDKYTTGLVMLTNDGELAHKLLSPKNHVAKSYSFSCLNSLTDEDIKKIEKGVYIAGGHLTKPCKIKANEDMQSGTITITEGKYHQIKQMIETVDNEITALKRITFGTLSLDGDLEEGTYRPLTEQEINSLKELVNDKE